MKEQSATKSVAQTRPPRVVPAPQPRRKCAPLQTLSWSLPVPPGAYSRIRAWDGRTQWLAQLDQVLRSHEGEQARREVSITHDTLLRIATLDAEAADSRNGRGVATAHETVANTIGCCKRTVQRGRDLIQRLGFAVVVVEGRYLTREERAEAAAIHGHAQRRAASVRALTVPENVRPVENVHLPRKGLLNPLTYLRNYSPKRTSVRKAASRPGANRKRNAAAKTRQPYAPAVAHVAAELTNRLPFLGQWRSLVTEKPGQRPVIRHQGKHLGSICKVIVNSGIDTRRLTVADVLDVLDRITKETAQVTLTGNFVANPLGYLTTLLRRVKSYVEHSGYATAAERHQAAAERRAQLAAERAAARAEREAEQARANTPEAVAAREAFSAAGRATNTTR